MKRKSPGKKAKPKAGKKAKPPAKKPRGKAKPAAAKKAKPVKYGAAKPPKEGKERKLTKSEKKLVEKRKALMKEAESLLTAIVTHPMLKSRGEMEAAEGRLISMYKNSDEVVQQYILFILHEQLSRGSGFKAMHNFEHFKRVMGEKADVLTVRRAVYRSMFNFTSSLEGLVGLLMLLGELGDAGAAKLISYHLTYYSAAESSANQMLRNAATDALAGCHSLYALDVLLSYARYSERNERILFSLGEWERKLETIKMPPELKTEYLGEIHSLIMGEGGRGAHYR